MQCAPASESRALPCLSSTPAGSRPSTATSRWVFRVTTRRGRSSNDRSHAADSASSGRPSAPVASTSPDTGRRGATRTTASAAANAAHYRRQRVTTSIFTTHDAPFVFTRRRCHYSLLPTGTLPASQIVALPRYCRQPFPRSNAVTAALRPARNAAGPAAMSSRPPTGVLKCIGGLYSPFSPSSNFSSLSMSGAVHVVVVENRDTSSRAHNGRSFTAERPAAVIPLPRKRFAPAHVIDNSKAHDAVTRKRYLFHATSGSLKTASTPPR